MVDIHSVSVYYMQSVESETKFAKELHERVRREFPEVKDSFNGAANDFHSFLHSFVSINFGINQSVGDSHSALVQYPE